MMNNYSMEELLPIVIELTKKYTSNESTSISYDTARMLMKAVIYCIDEFYKSSNDNEIIQINKPDAKMAYDIGYQLVIQKTIKAQELYEKIINDFQSYKSICYYDTVVKGFPSFFLYYDIKFKPQDHLLMLDYPILKNINNLCGVNIIYQYLQFISLEQKFLSAFSYDKIIDLLKRFHEKYEELFINICSIVLRNALGCMIVGKKINSLQIEIRDYDIIKSFVLKISQNKLHDKLCSFILILVQKGFNNNLELYNYLINDIDDFTVELINAVKNDCLEAIFPLLK